MPTCHRRIPLRLHDVIAATLAAAFAVLCVWTWNHLRINLDLIHKEADEARAKLDAWAQLSGPADATQLEANAADRERDRNKSLDRIDAIERDVHASKADESLKKQHLSSLTDDSRKDGITYNGTWFTPGPKPDPAIHDIVSPAVIAWEAKAEAAHRLNMAISSARQASEEAQARVQNATESLELEKEHLARIASELTKLRDMKNSMLKHAANPHEMDKLRDAAASMHTRNMVAVAVHAPFLVITMLYAISSFFRLLVLREALGTKRVTRAD